MSRTPDARRKAITHHRIDEHEMVAVLSIESPSTAGHDVGRRVDALAACKRCSEDGVVLVEGEGRPTWRPKFAHEELPRRDAVEEFEEHRAEENLLRLLAAFVDDVTNEVLADAVASAVCVRELVHGEDGVFGPGWWCASEAAEEDVLALCREAPIRGVQRRWLCRFEPSKHGGCFHAMLTASLGWSASLTRMASSRAVDF